MVVYDCWLVGWLVQTQGDQIGRIFAYRAIVFFFGQLFENYKGSPNVWATFV
jgi:hypothetical protein